MAEQTKCLHCNAPFEVSWGRWTLQPKRRLYCGYRCRTSAARARARARNPDYFRKARRKAARSVKGRICKWAHCRVDDKHHINNWNAPNDTCPSCAKQLHRKEPCTRCGGPQYGRKSNSLVCPTCSPRAPKKGEALVVLVCSATGREREIVRSLYWVTPDGPKLATVHDDGIAVIDVAPDVWAKYRI